MQQQRNSEEVQLKPKISPALLEQYKKVFDKYDKQQGAYVQAKDVPPAFRILGVTISEQEVLDLLGDRAIKTDNPLISSKIQFADFLGLLVDKENEMAMREELLQSFRIFDPEKLGCIPVSEMRYYLRTYGVAMNEDEVEEMLKESEPEDGYVKYEKFIDKILDKA